MKEFEQEGREDRGGGPKRSALFPNFPIFLFETMVC